MGTGVKVIYSQILFLYNKKHTFFTVGIEKSKNLLKKHICMRDPCKILSYLAILYSKYNYYY